MRLLVAGGTGFIGQHVVRILHEQGHDVTVYHRGVHEPALPEGVRHVHSDLAAVPMLTYAAELLRERFDVVVHMTLMSEADTEAALDAFRGRVDRLVVPSSGDVYAAHGQLTGKLPAQRNPLDRLAEDAPLRPELYPYGRTVPSPWGGELRDYDKILVEEAVIGDREVAGTAVRLPAVYGPGDHQRRLLPWVSRMVAGREAILLGERQSRFRFTHGYVENVAAALAVAAVSARAIGRVYNVGEDPTPTMAERARDVGRALGWAGRIACVPDEELPAHLQDGLRHVTDLAYDTSRIRGELGYREVVGYDEGLRRSVAWESQTPAASLAQVDFGAEDAVLKRV